ncbi:acetyl-CoA carboxylase biotin carboxyl carrier protein [Priestia megaterium]|uniref:acetyl-CoA carboxylase biotin carboxyl carrier protein n=1 Tax=Priestia megaterium TaxID=1404 RepID=UPI00296E4CBC|nr:acetyl-CoA carboxylase biotin carboxyl carrier protein [Priestia megaterium]MDW4507194.1 acetyl-CoA carboxylase biotin carboxyl carrier protein [Priestia megaterium]
MLKIQEIREIIKLVDQSSIEEFTYEHEGSKIKMKKKDAIVSKQAQQVVVSAPEQAAVPAPQAPAPAPAAQSAQPKEEQAAPAVDGSLHKITSPMVGTFYASSSPESDVYVTPGDKVQKDSVVCIVEAMKLFNEIEAEVKGEIVDVLVESGQLVEYGQPLFLVKPE